ncbi:serine/threonine-protein kinase RsbW [Geodermatophilus ruber]|uniref:Serine/threonine-protein kinase RsbW n=2 Tax=Geodermatophilus ruber TaxID=504800 RepID=A0A1I4CCX8_9ACTN|nr:serine/threonine-protein kinase RsbW [Geodermatophilus ruber]
MRFEIAVTEIAGNTIQHAADGAPIEFHLSLRARPGVLGATFRDRGRRADVDLDAARLPEDLAESEWGLALVLAAADRLVYRREGEVNHWQIVRNRHDRPQADG